LGANGTVDNVDVSGDVSGYGRTGGLVGTSEGSISGSTVNGDVQGEEEVGGLVGRLERGATITDSHTTGNVGGVGVVGGLVGYSVGSIFGSTASGIVSSNVPRGDLENKEIGGLVGVLHSGATITNSNASGDVSGRLSIGGLVGFASGTADGFPASSITKC
jgi:hypothetical protein